jgi:hypothetical protein
MTSLVVDRLLPDELWQRLQPLLPAPPPRHRGGVPRPGPPPAAPPWSTSPGTTAPACTAHSATRPPTSSKPQLTGRPSRTQPERAISPVRQNGATPVAGPESHSCDDAGGRLRPKFRRARRAADGQQPTAVGISMILGEPWHIVEQPGR